MLTDWQDNLIKFTYGYVTTKIIISSGAVGYVSALSPVFNRSMDTTDEFHVYRLELHRATETYKFYIDGNLVRTSTGVMNQSSTDSIRIGRWGPNFVAEMYID